VQVGERLYGYFAPTRYLLVPIDAKDINKHAMYVPRPQFPPGESPELSIKLLELISPPRSSTVSPNTSLCDRSALHEGY
jgi:hypothetical protein